MSTPAIPAPNPAAQPALGLTESQRVVNSFVAPTKTFTDLKRKANWFVPWLLIALASYAMVGVVAQKIGFEQVNENQMRLNARAQERMEKATPEQRAQSRAIGLAITKGISYASPLVTLLVLAVVAGVLMATFNFGFAAEIPFGTALAVLMYANLVGIVKAALVIISIFAGASPEGFIFQNPVASNLGALVDMTAHPALFALGSAIDVFTIWILILTGVGFACVSKLKRSTTLSVVFAWYAVITLAGVGFAAAFA